ncbi:interleukin-20-like [Mauremys reevesii]|uniref:interleukin-20-like n=1 Tax=Mauremys reevesii TaxID=260615 RepID=UPI00193F3916|nr:interleukin-20-like [Mauremys reevesii]
MLDTLKVRFLEELNAQSAEVELFRKSGCSATLKQILSSLACLFYRMMMTMNHFCCLVLLPFFFGEILTAGGGRLRFGDCELSGVSFQELRDYFGAIRGATQTQDRMTDVVLLKRVALQGVPISESCCLLRHLLRFYVESVFKHHEATSSLLRRRTSRLSNSFLSIKGKLKHCHEQRKCSCGEESNSRFQLIREEYEKLDRNTAANKALGELDVLFTWMEGIKN